MGFPILSDSRGIAVVLNRAPRFLAYPLVRPLGRSPVAVAAGDLDGDGRPDLALADEDTDRLIVLLNRTR